jgi:hypothetical protein
MSIARLKHHGRFGIVPLLLAGLWSGNVYAQSHNEMMSDLSAQEFQRDVQRRIRSGTSAGPSYYFTTDYAAQLTPEERKQLEARNKDYALIDKVRRDPALRRVVIGYWDSYQTRQSAGPGEFCAASYINLDGVITVSGFDKSWDGGLLIFMGKNIPKPKSLTELTVTLTQSGEKPATIKVFNPAASETMGNYGTLILAIPSMNAAVAAIEENQDFTVSAEGKELFRMSWKEGEKAREALRDCLRRR